MQEILKNSVFIKFLWACQKVAINSGPTSQSKQFHFDIFPTYDKNYELRDLAGIIAPRSPETARLYDGIAQRGAGYLAESNEVLLWFHRGK